jgi:hypothetical protein
VLSCPRPGDGKRGDPGRRLPVQEPGAAAGTFTWLVDRPSKRQRGGRDAAKPLVRNGLGRWLDLTKRPGTPDTVEQGVHAPAYLGRQVNAGAAANALLLLSARPSRGISRGEAAGVRHGLPGCRYLRRVAGAVGFAACLSITCTVSTLPARLGVDSRWSLRYPKPDKPGSPGIRIPRHGVRTSEAAPWRSHCTN